MAILEKTDAIAFAGGIGEKSPNIRARICKGLEGIGIKLDETKNAQCAGQERNLASDDSLVEIWVVPTNEEIIVARAVAEKLTGKLR